MDPMKNFAYSTVATAPSPATSGTSVVLAAGEGARFPQPSTDGAFYLTVWPTGAQPAWAAGGATGGNFEIWRCTARSTDTLTITRAQRSTTARTVVVGDQVGLGIYDVTLTSLGPNNGWTLISDTTFTYSAADAPVYTLTTSTDLTSTIPLGAKMQFTHSAAVKYGIVVAITSGTIKLYLGTDYTVSASAITAVSYSLARAPMSFPLDPTKWTKELHDASNYTDGPPTHDKIHNSSSGWFNLGGLSLAVPIGLWDLSYRAVVGCTRTDTGLVQVFTALSTGTTTASDWDLVTASDIGLNLDKLIATVSARKFLLLTTKTSYYLNIGQISQASGVNMALQILGATPYDDATAAIGWSPTIIRAVCAYL